MRWSSFAVDVREPDRVTMRNVLYPRDGYPFTLVVAIDYSLSAAGLTVTTTATNVGAERCPFGAGAHPYVTVGTPLIDAASLQAPGRVRLLADERGIPTGTIPTAGTEHDFRQARPLGPTVLDTAYTDLERGADGRAVVGLARRTPTSPSRSGSTRPTPTSCSSQATRCRTPAGSGAASGSSR